MYLTENENILRIVSKHLLFSWSYIERFMQDSIVTVRYTRIDYTVQ